MAEVPYGFHQFLNGWMQYAAGILHLSLSRHFSLAPKKGTANAVPFFGASDVTRTRDLLITSEMHYRLCYTSKYLARSLYR